MNGTQVWVWMDGTTAGTLEHLTGPPSHPILYDVPGGATRRTARRKPQTKVQTSQASELCCGPSRKASGDAHLPLGENSHGVRLGSVSAAILGEVEAVSRCSALTSGACRWRWRCMLMCMRLARSGTLCASKGSPQLKISTMLASICEPMRAVFGTTTPSGVNTMVGSVLTTPPRRSALRATSRSAATSLIPSRANKSGGTVSARPLRYAQANAAGPGDGATYSTACMLFFLYCSTQQMDGDSKVLASKKVAATHPAQAMHSPSTHAQPAWRGVPGCPRAPRVGRPVILFFWLLSGWVGVFLPLIRLIAARESYTVPVLRFLARAASASAARTTRWLLLAFASCATRAPRPRLSRELRGSTLCHDRSATAA